ncbi:MAG: FAD-dependent monooxygenase [Pseudomonadota bacterium]|nr:FAD-dependent monooxygenase [Pseudomonadota bacterium]
MRAGLSVAVIEARENTAPEEGRHVRVSAINLASERILTRLGVWENIEHSARSPFREISVWDAEGVSAVDFSYRDVGSAHLGHIVANHAIVTALLTVAKSFTNFTWLCPSELCAFDVQAAGVVIKLLDEITRHCQLLVAADGANSWVRNTLKIPMVSGAYEQTAIVVTVQTENAHGAMARQRFLQTGPLAFLPLKDPHSCSIVWSTTPEHAAALMQMSAPDLGNALTEGLQSHLGAVTVAEQPQSFLLKMHHVNHYVHPRVALIGDAAHTLHPLAGQGMNLGILDAACLGQVIKATNKSCRDIGRVENLRRYERWRRGDNQMMIDAMAFFKQSFAVDRGLLKQLRDLSLKITQRSQWLRRVFMRHAMGLRGELPDLAK